MLATTTTAETTIRPVSFRLPKPGTSDPYWGFSRSYYYKGEQLGYWKLIRICDEGKERGITLVPFAAVEAFVRSQMEGGEAK
jgi:hypothetical protein